MCVFVYMKSARPRRRTGPILHVRFCATFFLVGVQHGSGTVQLKRLGLDTPLKCFLQAAGGQISAPSPQVMQYSLHLYPY